MDMVRVSIRSWIRCAPLNSHISIAYYELAYIIHAVCNVVHAPESFGIKSFFSAGVMVERRGPANELPEVGADHHLDSVSHMKKEQEGNLSLRDSGIGESMLDRKRYYHCV